MDTLSENLAQMLYEAWGINLYNAHFIVAGIAFHSVWYWQSKSSCVQDDETNCK